MDGLGGIDGSSGLLFVLVLAHCCVCWFGDFGDGADSCHALGIEDCIEDCHSAYNYKMYSISKLGAVVSDYSYD